ncbi:MAG TPA: methionine gamma-lyase, partial [Bacteroidetes bacterium]|nr:methionine gamma-lyase [Bacteroidota bacterium]
KYLDTHNKVEQVYYPGLLKPGSKPYNLYKKQCSAAGAMISFDIIGGEKEAFAFLNHLRLFKLAVSLGSTEGLAQHPATMTHVGLDPLDRIEMGISAQLIRLSIGVENVEDILWDIKQALAQV